MNKIIERVCKIYLMVFCLAVIAVMLLGADRSTGIQPQLMMVGPDWLAPFGYDALGRNLFLRLLYSAQISIGLGLLCAVSCLLIGSVYVFFIYIARSLWRQMLLRLLEVFLSIPNLLLLLVASLLWQERVAKTFSFLPTSTQNFLSLAVSLSVFSWFAFARFLWRVMQDQLQKQYVQSAVVLGASPWQIWRNHIWPNIRLDVFVFLGLQIPHFLLAEGLLSFLGFGIHSPQSSWGLLFLDGWKSVSLAPHLIVGPALVFSFTVFAMTFLLYRYQRTHDPLVRIFYE